MIQGDQNARQFAEVYLTAQGSALFQNNINAALHL